MNCDDVSFNRDCLSRRLSRLTLIVATEGVVGRVSSVRSDTNSS